MSNRGDLLRVRARFKATQAEQEPRLDRFLALMGDGEGNLAVTGKPLFVYVRVLGRGVVECLNQVAPLRNDLPIIVGYDFKKPDTLQVLSIYEGGMSSYGPYAYLPPHHQAHEFQNSDGGDDVVWIQKQQVLPLLAHPTSPTSMTVVILDDWYPWDTGWHYFEETVSADLTAQIPALPAQARYVLISIDGATEALQYTIGALFPVLLPPPDAENMIPTPPSGSIPIVGVYLTGATTAIDWENLYDLRLFNQPVGGSVSPGPHALLDSTVHSDTATNTPPAQGSIIVADATPEWNELVHPGGAGYALTTDATDVIWDQTPAWSGAHTFNAGLVIGAGQGITLPDPGWLGFGPAASRLTMATGVPDVAEFVGFGQLNIENVLGHIGDPDTYMLFSPDFCGFRVGGVDFLYMDEGASDYFLIDPGATGIKVGIGTATVPHGGVGWAKFVIDGTAISMAGPHVQVTTTADDYPVFHQLNWSHDIIEMMFDAYYDGAYKSSDAGSNCNIRKRSDELAFLYDSGVAQGGAVAWNSGIVMDLTSGNVDIGTGQTVSKLDVSVPFARTDVGVHSVAFFGSNEAANPAGLRIDIIGAAAQADRTVSLGTIHEAVAWGGKLVLQPFAGNVGIGIVAPATTLDVGGTIGITPGNATAIIRRTAVFGSAGVRIQGNTNDAINDDTWPGAYVAVGGGALADNFSGSVDIVAFGKLATATANIITFSQRTGVDTITERGRFDLNGNLHVVNTVGISTAPAANAGLTIIVAGAVVTGIDLQSDNIPLSINTSHATNNRINTYKNWATLAFLSSGGAWTDFSSRKGKENFIDLDLEETLAKIIAIPVQKYKYKDTKDERHIGPVAEDFRDAFLIGDSKGLAAMDTAGVALLGVQALATMVQGIDARLTKLEVRA